MNLMTKIDQRRPAELIENQIRPTSGSKGVAVSAGLVSLDILIDEGGNRPAQMSSGGSCGNVSTILSTLGWESYPVARLDNDNVADWIRSDLEQWGVSTQFVDSEPDGSSPIIVQRNSNEKHSFDFRCPGCNSYFPRFKRTLTKNVPEYLSNVPKANIFYFDRAVPSAISLANHYRSNGALVLFEPNNSTDRDLFSRAVSASHILKYSNEMNVDARDAVNPWLHIETLGERGLRFRLQDESWNKMGAVEPKEIQDTSGAGDWCSAGLLDVLGSRWTGSGDDIGHDLIEEAIAVGQRLASMNCMFRGARGLLQSLQRNELNGQTNHGISDLDSSSYALDSSMMKSNIKETSHHCSQDSSHCLCETIHAADIDDIDLLVYW